MNSPQILTITNSIAALVVAGLTIRDIDEIPENCTSILPVCFPRVPDFITDLSVDVKSFGSSAAAKDLIYTLNYRFCYAPTQEGQLGLMYYGEMVDLAMDFIFEVMENDALTGAIDIQPVGALNFGLVTDPVGNLFHGCDIALKVLEFAN